MGKNPHVFLDITIGTKAAGRVVIELFKDLTPFTVENFRGLCSGDYGKSEQGYLLSYLDNLFHKVVPKRFCAAGDIVHNNGQGGDSIYTGNFVDEDFTRRHSHAGLVATLNKGPNCNNSQFLMTLGECSDLDGKGVVFGRVVEGMSVLRQIEKVSTDSNDFPKVPVRIFNCGELDDGREHIKFEEFKDQIQIYRAFIEKKAQKREEHLKEYYSQTQPERESEEHSEDSEENEIPQKRKLTEIKEKLKEAKKLNETAIMKEKQKRDPSWKKKQKKKDWQDKEKEFYEELDLQGIPPDKKYLTDNLAFVSNANHKAHKKHKKSTYGWEVFNEDSLLRAYKRRVNKLQFDPEEYKNQQDPNYQTEVNPQKLDQMAEELESEAKRRKKFSKKRTFMDDLDVNFINERNRVYNAKLQRHFKEYAAEMKANLERGTAI